MVAFSGHGAAGSAADGLSAQVCLPDATQPHTDAESPMAAVAPPKHHEAFLSDSCTDLSSQFDAPVGSSPLMPTDTKWDLSESSHMAGSKAAQACNGPVQGLSQVPDVDGSGCVAADRGTVLPDTGLQAIGSKDAAFLQMLFCCPITKVMS